MTTKFEVTGLDLSGLTDEDLQDTRPANNNKDFLSFLKTPGAYTFTILEAGRVAEDKLDGAGKKWGSFRILASADGEGAKTNVIKSFLDVPVETAVYTSKAGTTSKVKTQIFVKAMSAIMGKKILTADIPGVVSDLSSIIVPGATFRASVKYKNDHITKDAATGTFAITMANGTNMVDENGTALSFADHASAKAYYTQVTSRMPAVGMDIVSYLLDEVEGDNLKVAV